MNYDPYTFRLPPQAYTPAPTVAASVATEQEIRREYSRLRSIYVKRAARLSAADLPYSPYQLPTISEIRAEGGNFAKRLSKYMARAASAVSDPETTIAGGKRRREMIIHSLHASGYSFVNEKNFKRFGQWMEAAREVLEGQFYDSDMAAQAFEFVEKANIPQDAVYNNFTAFLTNLDEVKAAYEAWKVDRANDPSGEQLNQILQTLL